MGCQLKVFDPSTLFLCTTSVQESATLPAFLALREELADIAGERPLADDEIARTRAWVANVFRYQRDVGGMASFYGHLWRHGADPGYLVHYPERALGADADAVRSLSAELARGPRVWVIVGDAARVRPGIEALGLPIEAWSAAGRPL